MSLFTWQSGYLIVIIYTAEWLFVIIYTAEWLLNCHCLHGRVVIKLSCFKVLFQPFLILLHYNIIHMAEWLFITYISKFSFILFGSLLHYNVIHMALWLFTDHVLGLVLFNVSSEACDHSEGSTSYSAGGTEMFLMWSGYLPQHTQKRKRCL